MDNKVFEKVKEILRSQLPDGSSAEISLDDNLTDLGINSLLFVKIAVALETEFDIEFKDEDLDIKRFKTIGDIVCYVEDKVSANI